MRAAQTYRGARRNLVRRTGIWQWRAMGYTEIAHNAYQWAFYLIKGVRKEIYRRVPTVQIVHGSYQLTAEATSSK